MAAYSTDLRKRIVAAHIEEGENKSEVARCYSVSRRTVERYVKRFEKGELAATRHPRKGSNLNEGHQEVLRKQVAEHNDWTLEQHAEALAKSTGIELTKSTVDNYFRRLGIRRKKRAFTQASEMTHSERSGAKR